MPEEQEGEVIGLGVAELVVYGGEAGGCEDVELCVGGGGVGGEGECEDGVEEGGEERGGGLVWVDEEGPLRCGWLLGRVGIVCGGGHGWGLEMCSLLLLEESLLLLLLLNGFGDRSADLSTDFAEGAEDHGETKGVEVVRNRVRCSC